MKRYYVTPAVVLAATVAFAPVGASAESKCANPTGSVEQRACEMAAAGPSALRQFVERTQGIYGLYYHDFVSEN